jgi:Ca2+-binding RTX toxin-like protein
MAQDVFRFFNHDTEAWFYTTSSSEASSLVQNLSNMRYEGATFSAGSDTTEGTAVYRFYNTSSGSHFFTSSETEKSSLQENNPEMTFEGTSHYTVTAGDIPLERFYRSEKGFHLYTSDQTEKDDIIANNTAFTYEGEAYNVNSVNSTTGVLYTGTTGDDFLYGYADDTISGGDGKDVILGDSGADILSGGAGNDTIVGGEGVDTVTGGSGSDNFVIKHSGEMDSFSFSTLASGSEELTSDTITDFNQTDADIIDLRFLTYPSITTSITFGGDSDFQSVSFSGGGVASFVVQDQTVGSGATASYEYLSFDLDGDGVQDGVVKLDGFSGILTSSDFLL